MKSKIKYISFIISINSIIFINNVSAGISENKSYIATLPTNLEGSNLVL